MVICMRRAESLMVTSTDESSCCLLRRRGGNAFTQRWQHAGKRSINILTTSKLATSPYVGRSCHVQALMVRLSPILFATSLPSSLPPSLPPSLPSSLPPFLPSFHLSSLHHSLAPCTSLPPSLPASVLHPPPIHSFTHSVTPLWTKLK